MKPVTDDEAKQILAANIRQLLDERSISGRELAKMTGDNPVTINRLLRGVCHFRDAPGKPGG